MRMSKQNIIDIIAMIMLVVAWIFFFSFKGHTKFDINGIFTLPLLIALEATAIFLIYAIWRYHTMRGGQLVGAREILRRLYSGNENSDADNKDKPETKP